MLYTVILRRPVPAAPTGTTEKPCRSSYPKIPKLAGKPYRCLMSIPVYNAPACNIFGAGHVIGYTSRQGLGVRG